MTDKLDTEAIRARQSHLDEAVDDLAISENVHVGTVARASLDITLLCDALDAKDAEIGRLRDALENIYIAVYEFEGGRVPTPQTTGHAPICSEEEWQRRFLSKIERIASETLRAAQEDKGEGHG